MSTFDLDPFTLVHDKLWELLESGSRFRQLVKSGNRIKLSRFNDRKPMKEQVQTADLPEVTIIPVSGNQILQTSGARIIAQVYRIVISSGEQRINPGIFPIKFAILCAMQDWVKYLMTGITWRTTNPVVNAKLTGDTDGASDSDLARGIEGWSTLMNLEVWFSFDKLTLIAEK